MIIPSSTRFDYEWVSLAKRIAAAEAFFANLGADIRHGGAVAYYAIDRDCLQMPQFEKLQHAQSYYAARTRAHFACVANEGWRKWLR